jgi:DNA modification methylase
VRVPADLEKLLVPIDSLREREGNPRQGNLEAIKESLRVNGQYRPVVANKRTSEILAGNHTYKAARDLGWEEIAATWVDADEDQAARIVLIDNRANDLAEYDDQALWNMLSELDDLEGTGYDETALTHLLQELGEDAVVPGNTDPDEVPETPDPDNTRTEPGDVWLLGPHRLICGDSTDQAVIDQLMDGSSANLLLTDPPYGVNYSKKANTVSDTDHRDIANDNLSGEGLRLFLQDALSAAASAIPAGAPFYCFLPDAGRVEFELALQGSNMSVRQTLIWVKQTMVLGQQDYQSQHEPIFYGWKEGAAHTWYGGFDKKTLIEKLADPTALSKDELLATLLQIKEAIQTTAIEHDRPSKSGLHPTTKPVGLLEKLIHNSSKYGDIVLDIFGGSGSTLIAAQRTGRRGYLVELDPGYCDVIVQRWEDFTGDKAEKA